jgi:hypothetical protein
MDILRIFARSSWWQPLSSGASNSLKVNSSRWWRLKSGRFAQVLERPVPTNIGRRFVAVAVALMLSWGGAQRLDAQLVPGGLRDFASPAHLWLEGRVWRSADGATSVPRLVVHAACDPYYFDAEEVETTAGRGRLFLCEANLPGLCGEFRLTVTSGPLLAARPQKWHKKRPDECSVWKEQLRHFFDPRYNSVAILEKWAQFDRLSTATVASYDLRTGRRIFVFGPDGVLSPYHCTPAAL